MGEVAGLLYRAAMFIGSLWCHQMPERSPHIFGMQIPLCWRCAGIAVGSVLLIVWLVARKSVPPMAPSLILALLMPLDVFHAAATNGNGSNWRRLLTGILWGVFGTSLILHLTGSAWRAFTARSTRDADVPQPNVAMQNGQIKSI